MKQLSDKYKNIGDDVISELFPHLLNAKIAWLESNQAKRSNGKTVYAECEKVNAKYEWICDYDFMITVYEPNVLYFEDDQIKILLEHELMHAGFDGEVARIIPHDAEEFVEIIRKYGIDWAKPKGDIDVELDDIDVDF